MVWVIPVDTWIGKVELILESLSWQDGILRNPWNPVISVVQPKPVPVDGGWHWGLVSKIYKDPSGLRNFEKWPRDLLVECQHGQLSVANRLSHKACFEVERPPVRKPDHLTRDCLWEC